MVSEKWADVQVELAVYNTIIIYEGIARPRSTGDDITYIPVAVVYIVGESREEDPPETPPSTPTVTEAVSESYKGRQLKV